jgi:RNA polymerase sigma-70 factor (ECF subfamily)
MAVPSAPPAGGALANLEEAADRDAVERTLGGDVEAFAGVVRRHGGRLVGLCARMVGDRALGEELAQESLARAYSSVGRWRGDCRFRHWLTRVAMNCCRDYLKAGARAEQPAELELRELAALQDPERSVAGREVLAALEAAIAQLPDKYREAFVLFHLENQSYEEIRGVTGMSVPALKVRVHRARSMLRRALGELLEEEVGP